MYKWDTISSPNKKEKENRKTYWKTREVIQRYKIQLGIIEDSFVDFDLVFNFVRQSLLVIETVKLLVRFNDSLTRK